MKPIKIQAEATTIPKSDHGHHEEQETTIARELINASSTNRCDKARVNSIVDELHVGTR
eukprot:m.463868 g.463868  ORF g.463868 m.463868 type:complete len:59 (+) comp57043_c0_seq6:340-516(+)